MLAQKRLFGEVNMALIKKIQCQTCGAPMEKIGEKKYHCDYCGMYYEEREDNEHIDSLLHVLNEAALQKNIGKFEEAIREYETIIEETPECYLAYWGALLADYGVLFSSKGKEKSAVFYQYKEEPILENHYYRNLMSYCPNEDEKNLYFNKALELENIRIGIVKKIKKDNTDVIISTIEENDSEDTRLEYEIANQLYEKIKNNNSSVFWSAKNLKETAYQDYEPILFSALYHAKKLIIITKSVEDSNVSYVKDCWKRFNKLGNVENKEIIFLPLKNNPNDYALDLRKSHIIENSAHIIDDTLKCVFPNMNKKESVNNISKEQKDVVSLKDKNVKNDEPKERITRNVEINNEPKETIKVSSGDFGPRGTSFGSIQTNSEALRRIASDLKKYNQTQIAILNQCLSDLSYISHEWNDNNFENLFREISSITNNFENNLSEFDHFSEWLNQKAEIIERQKDIKK